LLTINLYSLFILCNVNVNPTGKHAMLHPGPIKEEGRCMDKVEEYATDADHPARPAAQYLLDILRYTVTFEDVYAVTA
jgi:hypothetical protein